MSTYVNASTRLGGVDQIVVPERETTVDPVEEAPFDGIQYVRMNGEWVPIEFPEVL